MEKAGAQRKRGGIMNWKGWVYPLLPSRTRRLHEKRRKGLGYRHVPAGTLECQREQDRVFWNRFLKPEKGGRFLEVGGDGVVGSHTLGLELEHGWKGVIQIQGKRALSQAKKARGCPVQGPGERTTGSGGYNLLALHPPDIQPDIRGELEAGRLQPRWVIVENREPDPQWCRWLEGMGYKPRFFFHDDEYYELQAQGS